MFEVRKILLLAVSLFIASPLQANVAESSLESCLVKKTISKGSILWKNQGCHTTASQIANLIKLKQSSLSFQDATGTVQFSLLEMINPMFNSRLPKSTSRVIQSIEDLRLLPYMQAGLDLILVMQQPLEWNERLVKKVSKIAKSMHIRIHTIQLSQSLAETDELSSKLSTLSGGEYVRVFKTSEKKVENTNTERMSLLNGNG